MAANALVEIGTRGTVASLVLQEIEYFRRLESGSHDHESNQKPQSQITSVASSSGHLEPKLGLVDMEQKKKKKRGSWLLPNICSGVNVVDKRPSRASRFGYQNLKADATKLQC